jgi:hypothetical protein
MTCPHCDRYRKFIQAMIDEFAKYGSNKTAAYYKGQCEKILEQTDGRKETEPV